ncbi:MAG: carboxypeptidase-like regulatory domain-containing protein [Singulisphaera sp.]
MSRLTGALLALVCLACGGAARSGAAEPEGVAGRVVDHTGAGVASAKVWVVGGSRDEPEAVAEATTDGQGAFSFPGFWEGQARKGPPQEDHALLQCDGPGRRRPDRLVDLCVPREHGVNQDWLVETGEAGGRVVDAAGKPVAGAEVIPAVFSRSHAKRSSADYVRLIPGLARPLAATTAEDGSFMLRRIPKGCEVQATVSTRGFGAPRVSWDSTKPVTIALEGRLGSIEGRLVTPDARLLPSELSLSLHRSPPDHHPGGSFQLLYNRTLKVGGGGRFRSEGVPPGRYAISVWADPDSALQCRPDPRRGGRPRRQGRRRERPAPPPRDDHRSGRRRDERRRGHRGRRECVAPLGAITQQGDSDETDGEGRYTVNVAPGKILIQPSSTPKSHLASTTRTVPGTTSRPTATGPTPAAAGRGARRRRGRRGRKPVERAEVHLLKPDPMGFTAGGAPRGPRRTGPSGSNSLTPTTPCPCGPGRRKRRRMGPSIRPGKQSGKLTLPIEPKNASRVHGPSPTAREARPRGDGQALVGQELRQRKDPVLGVGSVLEAYTTDGDGRLASSALWPGDRYKVTRLEAEGYGKAESPEITGRAGVDHDFSTIRLLGTGAHVGGRVVDTAGKPVAGATIFNRGDAPKAVTTSTDAGGKFRLDGLFVGGKYAFARKDGYRFTGVRVERDSDDVTLTLRGVDETPPPWAPVEPATSEEEKAFAKRVLTKLWERYGKDASKNGVHLHPPHGPDRRADGAEVVGPGGGRYDAHQPGGGGGRRRDRRRRGGRVAHGTRVGSSQYILQGSPSGSPGGPREALKFAEEAAVQARAMEQPNRAGAMAKSAAVLVRLGRKEAGLALVNEAAEAAARMGFESRQAYARGNVAGALAPFDVERALALVEPMKDEGDRDRYLGFIATALAGTDPERALAVAAKISERSSTPQSVKVAIAYALGVANLPDDAVRAIQGMKGYAAAKYQAEAYGWPRWPSRARQGAPRPSSTARRCRWTGRKTSRAGPISAAGPDRPRGSPRARSVPGIRHGRVVARPGLAAVRRAPRPVDGSPVAGDRRAVLALTDPGAARQILRDLEARSACVPTSRQVADRRWLMAWP